MKKKSYFDKAGKSVLIGTSVIILGGMAGCSEMPNDTPPTTLDTKGTPCRAPRSHRLEHIRHKHMPDN